MSNTVQAHRLGLLSVIVGNLKQVKQEIAEGKTPTVSKISISIDALNILHQELGASNVNSAPFSEQECSAIVELIEGAIESLETNGEDDPPTEVYDFWKRILAKVHNYFGV